MNAAGTKGRDARFAFGRNWTSYAELIDATRISEAEAGLQRLVGSQGLAGRRFLDIGCGSGLHSLAALRLRAAEVVAVDFDTDSVATTRELLTRNAPDGPWRVEQTDVLRLDPSQFGRFDTVYSWGVLHHTGKMEQAVECAASLVASGGEFIFALYRKTPCCGFWALEKRWYSCASPRSQRIARALYIAAMRLAFMVRGQNFRDYVRNYHPRGMDFHHDMHDWLGGYPYESISPSEVGRLMARLGFEPVRSFLHRSNLGLLGSGCDEYAYRRPA